MPLRRVSLVVGEQPLPDAMRALLDDAGRRLAAYFARDELAAGKGAIPSDHEAVCRWLQALRAAEPLSRTFVEWGSGFGVVAIAAAQLGFVAHGIELDAGLVSAARELAATHRASVQFVVGSFVPPGYEVPAALTDLETRTIWRSDDAYEQLERDPDEFDVVFAYPWPGEEAVYRDVFRRCADVGAVLVLWTRLDGVQAWRKVPKLRG